MPAEDGGGWLARHWEGLSAVVIGSFAVLRWLWQTRTDASKAKHGEQVDVFGQAVALLGELRKERAEDAAELVSRAARIADLEGRLRAAEDVRYRLSRAMAGQALAALGEELADPAETLGELLDALPVALVVTRIEGGRFAYPNAAFCALLGASRAQLQSEAWTDRIVAGDLEVTRRAEARALAELVEVENAYRTGETRDGAPVALSWLASQYLVRGVSLGWARKAG